MNLNVLNKRNQKSSGASQKKVLGDRAIKKAAKLSIKDQRKMSRKASKIRTAHTR